MRQEVGRRAFVGSIIVGAPLLAGVPSLFAEALGRGGARPAGGGAAPLDPFIDYSIRELAAIERRVHASRKGRGEDARAAAQQLRTAAIYLRGRGVDREVTQAVRAAVDANGRDNVLYADGDSQQTLTAMRRFGFELDALPDTGGLDYATRVALLDDLASGGITPMLSRIADTLGRASGELDRRAALDARPLLRVDDSSWWSGFCSSLQSSISQLQAEASFLLLASFFDPDLIGAYYLVEAAIGIDYVIYGLMCSW